MARKISKDRLSRLGRKPKAPKSGGAGAHLRQSQKAYLGRCKRVAMWEKRQSEAQAVLTDLVTNKPLFTRSIKTARRLVKHTKERLAAAKSARLFTERRIEVMSNVLCSGTLSPDRIKISRKRFGRSVVTKLKREVDRSQDVVDAAIVQAGCSDKSSALQRIISRVQPKMAKLLNIFNYPGLTADEKTARRDEGIWRATLTWDPHDRTVWRSLSSHAHSWVRRTLQPRVKADHLRQKVTKRTKTATGEEVEETVFVTSLDSICAGADGDSSVTPVAVSASKSRGVAPTTRALGSRSGFLAAASVDIHAALDGLSELDQEIVRRVFVDKDKGGKAGVAKMLGISRVQLAGRIAEITTKLRVALRDYEGVVGGPKRPI